MRKLLALCLFVILPTFAHAEEDGSSAYSCHFVESSIGAQSIRMKEYVDEETKMKRGKVDVLENAQVVSSFHTEIYQFPMFEQKIYIQSWYTKEARVDAQLSMTGANKEFYASYVTKESSRQLYCTEIY